MKKKEDINVVLKQVINIVESFEHPITRDEIELYGLNKFIHSISNKESSSTTGVFDFGVYHHDDPNGMGIIKVSRDIIWLITQGFNKKVKTTMTPEEIFQQSTIEDYGNIGTEMVNDCMKLLKLLEHLWEK